MQKILQESLQPKLKGASVWPLIHAIKWLQAESVNLRIQMYQYCKEKIDQSQLQ